MFISGYNGSIKRCMLELIIIIPCSTQSYTILASVLTENCYLRSHAKSSHRKILNQLTERNMGSHPKLRYQPQAPKQKERPTYNNAL